MGSGGGALCGRLVPALRPTKRRGDSAALSTAVCPLSASAACALVTASGHGHACRVGLASRWSALLAEQIALGFWRGLVAPSGHRGHAGHKGRLLV